jgi:hypothetical protein
VHELWKNGPFLSCYFLVYQKSKMTAITEQHLNIHWTLWENEQTIFLTNYKLKIKPYCTRMNIEWYLAKLVPVLFMWIRFQDGHQCSRKINIGPYGKMNNYFFLSETTSLFKPKLYNNFYVNRSEIQDDDNFCRILKFNIIGKMDTCLFLRKCKLY